MKTLLALLFLSIPALASDTTSVSKSALLKDISTRHEQATRKFQFTLTAEQLRLQKSIESLEVQYQTIEAIKQDSIKVSR